MKNSICLVSHILLCVCVCVCLCVCATEKSQTNKKLVVEKLLQLQLEEKRKSSNRKKLCANVLMQKFVNRR